MSKPRDIVEQIREAAGRNLLPGTVGELMNEAVREIERLRTRPEATAWTRANHREESLTRAIHALPGTQWTFWIELEGVTYKHEHILPPFIAPDRSTPQEQR